MGREAIPTPGACILSRLEQGVVHSQLRGWGETWAVPGESLRALSSEELLSLPSPAARPPCLGRGSPEVVARSVQWTLMETRVQ